MRWLLLLAVLVALGVFGVVRATTEPSKTTITFEQTAYPWVPPPPQLTSAYIEGEHVRIDAPGKMAVVSGKSMLPIFGDGSRVVYTTIPFGQVRVGDIIVFDCFGTAVVHQAMVLANGAWVTRGVNNNAIDFCPVSESTLRGRVVAVVY